MEERELKDEQLEEGQGAALKEAEPGSVVVEKKPLAQAVREKAEAVPLAVEEGASKAVQFVKDHRKEIAAGAITVAGFVACLAESARENNRLRAEMTQLSDDFEIECGVSDRLASRVAELERLHDEKDDYFREVISDGLRHGSSLAGKHMADLKQYLNEE